MKFQDYQFDKSLGYPRNASYYDTTRSRAVTLSNRVARAIRDYQLTQRILTILLKDRKSKNR